jgi:hypothetical protein
MAGVIIEWRLKSCVRRGFPRYAIERLKIDDVTVAVDHFFMAARADFLPAANMMVLPAPGKAILAVFICRNAREGFFVA